MGISKSTLPQEPEILVLPSGFVTLLTDFGERDSYVGIMKGVIAQVNPQLQVIDLCHQIPPQNVALAGFQLQAAYRYFPVGTVHVAVVDPGVGGTRRAIAVEIASGFLVGPDNGIFSGVLRETPAIAAVSLTNPQFWHTPEPSLTFHGRDIFAPVAAHLASGIALSALGPQLSFTELHHLPLVEWDPVIGQGKIQAIDHFGNLITNIPGTAVLNRLWRIQIGDRALPGVATYSNQPPGALLGLIGSHGWIEIAVNSGNAQQVLRASLDDPVQLQLQ